MNVMIATDGNLEAEKAAALAKGLAGPDGKIIVYTVVEMPRSLISEMRAAATDDAALRERALSVETRQTQADNLVSPYSWAGDDAIVERYINRKGRDRIADVAAALEAAAAEHEVAIEEGENALKAILAAAEANDVDVIVVGTRGAGLFDGLLGSTSTKLMRHAPCSVALVR